MILLLLLATGSAGAQQFVSPKKVTTGITIAIEINDSKDLEFIKNNLRKFYGVQRVRVNGDVNIAEVAAVLELLDDLQDVQLVRYKGDFTDEVLLKLEWVDNITFYLKNGHEDAVLLNNNLGKLNGLTLVFEVVPDDYFFLESLKNLRSLVLIAPFVKKEAERAVSEAQKLKRLRKFGISLDKVDHLPMAVTQWPELQKITVIDNLSWILEKYTDNLSVLKRNIEYTGARGNLRYITFEYLAQEAELYPWDIAHIRTVWPSARFAAMMNESGDTSDVASFADFQPLKHPLKPAFDIKSPQPLLGNVQDGEYLFTGTSERDAIFYLGNEAALMVPKKAFRSGTDSAYSGNYALKVWWLNSPGEWFTHGLNLNYDSAKRNYEIAPAGLLYVSAANEKTVLELREGHFIKLVFRGRRDTSDRFYAWDPKRGKWENFYDYDYRFDDSRLAATDFYSFYGVKPTANETFHLDRSALQRRFEYDGYYYLLRPGEQRVSLESTGGYWVAPVYDRAPAAGSYTLKRGKNLIGIKKEYVDKKTEEGIVKFRVYDKTATLFPELKPFEDYIFEIATAMDPKEFSAKFIKNAVYCDIRIEQIGAMFEMALRTEEGVWRLHIQTPAEKFRNQHSKAKSGQNEFLRRFNKYQHILLQKTTAFNNYLNNYHNTGMSNSRNQIFYPTRLKLPASEEMRIRSTGAFVWGHPVLQPDTFNLIIKFTDAGGIPIDIKRAYVAHKKPFAYHSFGAEETYNCNINPSMLEYIACVDQKGKVYILTGVEFRMRRIAANSLVYLAMNELPQSFKTNRELEKILGISR